MGEPADDDSLKVYVSDTHTEVVRLSRDGETERIRLSFESLARLSQQLPQLVRDMLRQRHGEDPAGVQLSARSNVNKVLVQHDLLGENLLLTFVDDLDFASKFELSNAQALDLARGLISETGKTLGNDKAVQ